MTKMLFRRYTCINTPLANICVSQLCCFIEGKRLKHLPCVISPLFREKKSIELWFYLGSDELLNAYLFLISYLFLLYFGTVRKQSGQDQEPAQHPATRLSSNQPFADVALGCWAAVRPPPASGKRDSWRLFQISGGFRWPACVCTPEMRVWGCHSPQNRERYPWNKS